MGTGIRKESLRRVGNEISEYTGKLRFSGVGGRAKMQMVIKGKNLEITPALRDYAEKKVAKLDRFFDKHPVAATIMMSVERERHVVEVTLMVDGLLLRGEGDTSDMYASVDEVIDKLERQIHKYKTRIQRQLRGDVPVEGRSAAAVAAGAPAPQKPAAGPGEADDEWRDAAVRIVKTKRFAIKPMSVEEAAMQMELLGHDFFVFANGETEEVNVVYRRKDGNFGLIEPEF